MYSVYIVCPSVFILNNLKLNEKQAVKNIVIHTKKNIDTSVNF